MYTGTDTTRWPQSTGATWVGSDVQLHPGAVSLIPSSHYLQSFHEHRRITPDIESMIATPTYKPPFRDDTTGRSWALNANTHTPRMTAPALPRRKCVPLPPQINFDEVAPAINPILDYTGRKPKIAINLYLPSTSIVPPFDAPGCLFEMATYPPLPSLAVLSELLPWPIVVHKSSHRSPGVSVADVLSTICDTLQMQVDGVEASMIPCPRSTEYEKREHYRATKHVGEFLRGQHQFMGLSKSASDTDAWDLHVT